MQIASILEPKSNVAYILKEFKRHLPGSCEELKGADLEAFNKKMDELNNKKEPDAFGFIDYIVSKELSTYIQGLKPKGTKKKPLSFERLNLMVMPIFKYFESEKAKEITNMAESLDKYVDLVLNHTNINTNTQFETMLNLYLVLGTETVLKSTMFINMVNFLVKNK